MRFNPFARRRLPRRHAAHDSWLKPAAKQAIWGVVLLVFSLIVILSFFNQAGMVGVALLGGLRRFAGWLAYGIPLLLIKISYDLLRPQRPVLPRLRIVGALLATLGLLGLLHLIGVTPDDALQVAHEGKGGGYLGFMLTYPLSVALSSAAALLIFMAALIVGCFMTFNVSVADVWGWLTMFMPGRGHGEEHGDATDEELSDDTSTSASRFRISRMSLSPAKLDPDQLKLQEQHAQAEHEQQELTRKRLRAANRRYHLPPLDLLHSSSRGPDSGNIKENVEKIERTLENFNITVAMEKVNVGPTVTQYTLRPQEGIRLSQITALQNDLARALAAHPVRIEAPIPNTDLVGIEIPNKQVALVRIRDLFTSKEFRQSESPLTFALGKDVAGKTRADTLERMPHLLIAGATNSGKSVAIHAFMMSLLYRNSPALVRLLLIDPKRVELTAYNDIPHLLAPVIVDSHKTLNALKWALREMDQRYKLLEESGSRNLLSYNISNPNEAKPYIVIIVDELADLMVKHAREVEGPIVRLSQMARAVGIHLLLATQRPSVNVITGLIKANIPSRVAFKVASQVDSRTILDMAGAEKLVGTGDMLYQSSDQSKPVRLQGGYVSEDEVRAVVEYIKEHNPVDEMTYDNSITERASSGGEGSISDVGDDDLFEQAKEVVRQSGKASASLLQRRLRVGYARAARLIDMLEEQQFITPAEGNKPREILVRSSNDDYEASAPSDIESGDTEQAPSEEDVPHLPEEERW
ncbi:MAG: DNA translocase FtsK 4TM domain-containing protein [Candidatus Andersenbacteria bacterium]